MLRSRVWVQQLHSEDVNKQTGRVAESLVELRIVFLATIYFLVSKSYNVSFQVSCALLSQLTMAV